MNSKIIIFTALIPVFISCNYNNQNKTESKLNREISEHYTKCGQNKKMEAVKFLTANVKYYSSLSGDIHDSFVSVLETNYHKKPQVVLSILKESGYQHLTSEIITDQDQITSEFIINNIDLAYSIWDTVKWKNQVSFSNFCEYILPYRVGQEPIENWREKVINDTLLIKDKDKFYSYESMYDATNYLVSQLSNAKKHFLVAWGIYSTYIPPLEYSNLKHLNTGTCSELANLTTFVLRTYGIPTANDFTPLWGNMNGGHNWNALIMEDTIVPFIIPVNNGLGEYKGENCLPSKIYRKQFSINYESHRMKRGKCDFLPATFNNPMLKDVTNEYVPVHDIQIPTDKTKEEYAYLSAAKKENWVPIGWGKIKDNQASFTSISEEAVYIIQSINEDSSTPVSYPFIVNNKGEVNYYNPDTINTQNLTIKRKHPMDSEIQNSLLSMVGGQFQVSNDTDFKTFKSVYSIVEPPSDFPNIIDLNLNEKYRYVRYLSADSSQCYIADFSCFSVSGKKLTGNILGQYESQPLEYAFDDDVLTYYYKWTKDKNIWIGLDFDKPVSLSKISFSPRNDKNYIVIGNTYELFYWDNEWISLGKKVAADNFLKYEKVPTNCIFILKNYTEGVEERIFTYSNGVQQWK